MTAMPRIRAAALRVFTRLTIGDGQGVFRNSRWLEDRVHQRLLEFDQLPMRFIVSPMSKLVLVADTPWVINSVSSALAAEEWDVQVCHDPRAAVQVVSDTQPTAVIADLQVGSKGGMAVIRAIRQLGTPRPRLVMLLDRSADSFLSGRAGADAFVLKPIEPDALRRALSGVVGRSEEE